MFRPARATVRLALATLAVTTVAAGCTKPADSEAGRRDTPNPTGQASATSGVNLTGASTVEEISDRFSQYKGPYASKAVVRDDGRLASTWRESRDSRGTWSLTSDVEPVPAVPGTPYAAVPGTSSSTVQSGDTCFWKSSENKSWQGRRLAAGQRWRSDGALQSPMVLPADAPVEVTSEVRRDGRDVVVTQRWGSEDLPDRRLSMVTTFTANDAGVVTRAVSRRTVADDDHSTTSTTTTSYTYGGRTVIDVPDAEVGADGPDDLSSCLTEDTDS